MVEPGRERLQVARLVCCAAWTKKEGAAAFSAEKDRTRESLSFEDKYASSEEARVAVWNAVRLLLLSFCPSYFSLLLSGSPSPLSSVSPLLLVLLNPTTSTREM